jgi:hypothetical protein
MSTSLSGVTVAQLQRAIAIKEELQSLERELSDLLGAPAPAAPGPRRKRRTMSAAGRARIAAAAKARWAALRARKAGKAAPQPLHKAKKRFSAAARARMAAAAKARWAKVKAAGKSKL